MINHLRRTAGAAFFALALAIMATSASAKVLVTGRWDPDLPQPPFDNLGWTATINLGVSEDCIGGAESLPYIVNIFGRSFGCKENPLLSTDPFSILSAEVGIYDLTSNLIIDVLTFNPGSFKPFLLDLNTSGDITYLLSLTDSDAVRTEFLAMDGKAYDFKLSLPGAAPAVKYRAEDATGKFTLAPGVPKETDFGISFVSSLSEEAAVLANTKLQVGQTVFTAVPEPGSLALVALAIGAAGFASSRRPRRAA